MKNLYSIGDKVRIIDEDMMAARYKLEPSSIGTEFDGHSICFLTNMWKNCGKSGRVRKVVNDLSGYSYKVDLGETIHWSYDEDMLAPCFEDNDNLDDFDVSTDSIADFLSSIL